MVTLAPSVYARGWCFQDLQKIEPQLRILALLKSMVFRVARALSAANLHSCLRFAGIKALACSAFLALLAGLMTPATAGAQTFVPNWVQQSPAASPPARIEASMAYDAATGQGLLFGGDGRSTVFGDTWTWNGTTWTQQSPAASPPARNTASMAYDAASGQMVLFGGYGNSGSLSDTWTWNGTTWTRQNSAASPSPRYVASMAYDAASGQMVLFGGYDGTTYPGDTWTWGQGNFGSQALGSTSAAQTFNFSIPAGVTVGSIGILTSGASGLDFADGGSSTCAAQTYSFAANCVVNVTFNPSVSGPRAGAVVFFSNASDAGTVLVSVPLYGIGAGPQIAYGPGTATVIDPTVNSEPLNHPNAAAVDGQGDLYIADTQNDRVVEVPAGGGTATAIAPTVNAVALKKPSGVAVDGAGDLFIADSVNNRILEVPAGGGAATAIDPTVNAVGLSEPAGLAFDGAGDLFISDFTNSRIVEVTAGGGAATAIDPTVNGEGLNGPVGLAFDGAGDLFIADSSNSRIVEVPAGGGAPTAIAPTVNSEAIVGPTGVGVDAAGDLFIADYANDRIVEIPAGGGSPAAIDPTVNGASLGTPGGVALDGTGDLFICDSQNSRVVEINQSQLPALTFPTPTLVGTTDTTDGTQTVQIENIGNQALNITAVQYPGDFTGTSDPNSCAGGTSLNAGQECDVPVQFFPQNPVLSSENITLTDNNLNQAGVQQQIQANGTVAPPPATFSITATGPVVAGTPFTITVTALASSNTTDSTFNSSVTFTSSDTGFVNPGPLTLTNGVGQTTATLTIAGAQSITAAATALPAVTGTGTFSVVPGAATTFQISTPSSVTAGTPFNFTVTAVDAYGNVATGYSGTVQFLTTDTGTGVSLPVNSTLTLGTGTFAATLVTETIQTITAADIGNGAIIGTSPAFSVNAATAVSLVVTDYPTPWYTSATAQVVIAAFDQYGNLATGFSGPVTVTTSDSAATVTQYASFSYGVAAYSVVFFTPGPQSITASATGLTSGSETGISVGPLPSFMVTVSTDTTDGEDTLSDCTNQSLGGATPDASCSLRDALWAVGNLGAGTVTFSPSVFNGATTITLTSPQNSSYDFGALPLGANVTLSGPTQGSGPAPTNLVTISGPTAASPATGSAIFYAYGTPNTLNLTGPDSIANLNITNGNGTAATGDNSGTGGINTQANLTLTNCNFTGNIGDTAGAIDNYSGVLTINGGTFSRNSSTGLFGPDAGAIFSDTSTGTPKFVKGRPFASSQTSALAANAQVSGSAPGTKPGFFGAASGGRSGFAGRVRPMGKSKSGYLHDGAAAPLGGIRSLTTTRESTLASPLVSAPSVPSGPLVTVTNTTFSNNNGVDAGAFYDYGDQVTISGAVFTSNSASIGAGALVVDIVGLTDVYNSTFSGNTGAYAGAAFAVLGAEVQIVGSTLNGNSSTGIPSSGGFTIADGGGLTTVEGGYALLGYDTFYNNTSTSGAGAGAIADLGAEGGFVAAFNITVTGNTGFYGAMLDDSGSQSDIENSIASGNTTNDPNAATDGTSPDSNGMELVLGDVVTSPSITLAPLGNYGGPTQTLIPPPGSTAICAGSVTGLSNAYNNYNLTLPTDQRGDGNINSTYPGTGGSCVDAGSVQTNYALAFTTQPPSNPTGNLSITPAPVVGLTESGAPAAFATNSVTMTDSASLLTGTTSESLSSGLATFSNLIIPSRTSNDIFTATMALNPPLNLTATATVGVTVAPSPAVLYSPAPNVGTALGSSNVLFQWTTGTSATKYELDLGTTGAGASNLYSSGEITATSATVTTLPADGVTVFARLSSLISGVWQSANYTYVEGGALVPAMLSPTPGTVLSASQAFSWANGAGPTEYELYLGTIGVGSNNLYNSGEVTATSATVTIPMYGVTVFARLYQRIDGVWQYADTTYTEGGTLTPATLTPTAGSVLSASTNFSWPANGATSYLLYLGTAGVGSDNLYNSGETPATAVTANGLPTIGAKVYARFYQHINGAWQHADTTYTEGGAPTLATLSPTGGGILGASTYFSWANGVGPTEYQLYLGTIGVGSNNLYNSGEVTATSVTFSVPMYGVTVFARLSQRINGVWQSADTTYTEGGTLVRATLSPTPGAVLGASTTFSWPANGPTEYQLYLGTMGVGSNDLYNSGEVTATSVTFSVPMYGVTVFARLYQHINGVWQYADTTYTEGGTLVSATLSPAAGALLSASTRFSWAANGPTSYMLYLGTTGVGSNNLYSSGEVTATSETVTLPTQGVKVYARLYQKINGVWQHTDITYTEGGTTTPATLSPVAGVLSASQTFSWANGAGPAEYRLYLGTTGVGSNNLYNSGVVTATSQTVTLPTQGVTVYATLWQLINGTWQATQYTFTEP
jgi:sugar lactone lactonase YvrE